MKILFCIFCLSMFVFMLSIFISPYIGIDITERTNLISGIIAVACVFLMAILNMALVG